MNILKIFTALIIVPVFILADLPVGKTGQIIVYMTGDDGDYTIGQDKSYVKNENGTVTDNMLHLIWQNNYNDNKGYANNGSIPNLNHQKAIEYCNAIDLAGYTNWRLPTMTELQTLVDYSKAYPGPVIDDIFVTTTTISDFGVYWTGTNYASDTTQAWFVCFMWGYANRKPKSETNNVRCVRGDI